MAEFRRQVDVAALLMGPDGVPLLGVSSTPLAERVTIATGTSTAFATFGAVSGLKNYITAVSIVNTDADTAGYVDFRNGAAGAVLYTVAAPTGGTGNTAGALLGNGTGVLFATSANTALAYDSSGTLDALIISVSGFQAA